MITNLKGYDIEYNGELITLSNGRSAQAIHKESPAGIVLLAALNYAGRQHEMLSHVVRSLERAYERD